MFEDSDLTDVLNDFKRKFEGLVTQFRYQNSEIYNMDETGLPFEMALHKIITVKGDKRALIKFKGQTKQKVTGLFLIKTDGINCKPLIVLKGLPREESRGKLNCLIMKILHDVFRLMHIMIQKS